MSFWMRFSNERNKHNDLQQVWVSLFEFAKILSNNPLNLPHLLEIYIYRYIVTPQKSCRASVEFSSWGWGWGAWKKTKVSHSLPIRIWKSPFTPTKKCPHGPWKGTFWQKKEGRFCNRFQHPSFLQQAASFLDFLGWFLVGHWIGTKIIHLLGCPWKLANG